MLLQIEQQRLQSLMMQWLALEQTRPAFQVVALEQKNQITVNNLTFNTQVDRIDKLPDGSVLIIDYKTNLPSVQDWFGDRPDDAQLPIYCITHLLEPNGLLFAQVTAEKVAFKGIADKDIKITGVKPIITIRGDNIAADWPTQKKQWQKILTQLAQEFEQGYAKVDPKDKAKSCMYCQFHSLCRIYEKS